MRDRKFKRGALRDAVLLAKAQHISMALEASKGVRGPAAVYLGLHQRTFQRLVQELKRAEILVEERTQDAYRCIVTAKEHWKCL